MNALSLADRWPFRKHRDELVSTVIRDDPNYVEWCLYNTNIKLDAAARSELQEELDEEYWKDFDL